MALFSKSILKSLAQASGRPATRILTERASAAMGSDTFDIFLSHSSEDAEVILGLAMYFETLGHSTYVDWIVDKNLPRDQVTPGTAAMLKARMAQSKSLFYAASSNAQESRWMPWELGYFDGLRSKVAICPIIDISEPSDSYQGQEYLGLYPYVARGQSREDRREGLWIHESQSRYVWFPAWLNGSQPKEH